ncbi:MAG TPA: c-type cytochrome [Vicinamibacterales bacterium]|nr:c-type cytochrome [Vicinamibacterales bacterium]
MIALLLALLLSPAETRGRQIFLQGTSASGREVTPVFAGGPSPAPLACATCHGRDGRGRREGGIRSANIEWDTLARASAIRPAYDDPRLRRAITMGIDAGGRRLDPAMPRYRLWRDDADDLVAWLRRLGTIGEPGVSDTTLRVRVAGTMSAVFQAWADAVNSRGGIYGRRIEIADDDDTFALLGDPADDLTRRAVADEVPVVRAGTLDAIEGPWVFELGAAASDEVKSLLEAAVANGVMPVAIPAGPFADLCLPPGCVRADEVAAARAVLVLDARGMPPPGHVALVPSAIAGDALSHAQGDAYVAVRILPEDVDHEAASRYQLAGDHLVDQWSALAVARLAERALARAGRALTREAFVQALESEHETPTGFSPPVTFDPNRHHGIGTVRILRFEHQSGRLVRLSESP